MLKKHPYLYEIPLLYLALGGVNFVFLPEAPGYLGVDPHPYWLGILLFGFRYGVAAGLASGLLSALLYFGAAWFLVERYLFEDWIFYLLPSFFILIGVAVGLGVGRYKLAIATLKREQALLKTDIERAKEEIRVLQEINAGLEKRIVTRMSTLVTLYEGARRLESADLEELYRAILHFVAKTLEAEEAAVYLSTDDGWTLKESIGWKEYQKRPSKFGRAEGITGMAGSANKIVTIRDFVRAAPGSGPAPQLLGDAVMAGPLRRGERGEVVGVIAIQHLPMTLFNSASVNLFTFLLGWASRAIGHAAYLRELQSREIVDPEYQVYSTSYFQSRAQQEFARSKKYYLPLSIGLVHMPGLNVLPAARRERVLVATAQLLRESCREVDVVARFDDPQIPFALIFITASAAQTAALKKTIEEGFRRLQLAEGIPLTVGIGDFSPKTSGLDELISRARQGGDDATARIDMGVG